VTAPTDSLTDSLRVSLGKLAVLREQVRQREERIKAARAAFEATIVHEAQALEAEKRAMEAEDSAIRGLAMVAYETTGNKQPAPGVSVAVVKKLRYDKAEAFAWAKQAGMAIQPEQLDVKAFEKIAAAAELPFVEVEQVPSARIASDLTAAIGEGL
jgi:hypothetical protein